MFCLGWDSVRSGGLPTGHDLARQSDGQSAHNEKTGGQPMLRGRAVSPCTSLLPSPIPFVLEGMAPHRTTNRHPLLIQVTGSD